MGSGWWLFCLFLKRDNNSCVWEVHGHKNEHKNYAEEQILANIVTKCLKVCSDLYGPDGLLQRVEELKAEAVLLGGPLDQLARIEQHRSHPLAVFVGFVDE